MLEKCSRQIQIALLNRITLPRSKEMPKHFRRRDAEAAMECDGFFITAAGLQIFEYPSVQKRTLFSVYGLINDLGKIIAIEEIILLFCNGNNQHLLFNKGSKFLPKRREGKKRREIFKRHAA